MKDDEHGIVWKSQHVFLDRGHLVWLLKDATDRTTENVAEAASLVEEQAAGRKAWEWLSCWVIEAQEEGRTQTSGKTVWTQEQG